MSPSEESAAAGATSDPNSVSPRIILSDIGHKHVTFIVLDQNSSDILRLLLSSVNREARTGAMAPLAPASSAPPASRPSTAPAPIQAAAPSTRSKDHSGSSAGITGTKRSAAAAEVAEAAATSAATTPLPENAVPPKKRRHM